MRPHQTARRFSIARPRRMCYTVLVERDITLCAREELARRFFIPYNCGGALPILLFRDRKSCTIAPAHRTPYARRFYIAPLRQCDIMVPEFLQGPPYLSNRDSARRQQRGALFVREKAPPVRLALKTYIRGAKKFFMSENILSRPAAVSSSSAEVSAFSPHSAQERRELEEAVDLS